PEHGSHAVEQGAEDYQNQALGTFHEAYAAGADQGFGAGAGVADHDGADHYEGGQDYVEETLTASVKDEQAQELAGVGVAVDYGIEEGSEAGDAVGGAGDLSVDKVEKAGEDDDQAGIDEHALLGGGIGRAEQDGGPGVDDESHERENVGIDAGECEPAHDGVQQDSAGASEGGGPGAAHWSESGIARRGEDGFCFISHRGCLEGARILSPTGARWFRFYLYPRLTLWAAFLRRSAA